MRSIVTYIRSSVGHARWFHSRRKGFDALTTHRLASKQFRTGFFTTTPQDEAKKKTRGIPTVPAVIIAGGLFVWALYPSEEFDQISEAQTYRRERQLQRKRDKEKLERDEEQERQDRQAAKNASSAAGPSKFPGFVRKLQRELSLAPGSLADEIWRDAHDPFINPEIRHEATVRISTDLCDDEKEFLARRKMITRVALANRSRWTLRLRHLHFWCFRLLLASDPLLLLRRRPQLPRILEHLKSRAAIHIAYPPVAFQALVSAPTSKYLLSGLVEKLRGDPQASFGLVDIYGLLLAARFLVPKGELEVCDSDFKLSNQRQYIKYGQNPMPIYTAVRHEIPGIDDNEPVDSVEAAKEKAAREAWFQWFEITPYEFFCEEFSAGIPTWALGRKFNNGVDVPPEEGFHLPEVRVPFLMGVFGSAFCATLSHYYREVRPLVQSLSGFMNLDKIISGRYNNDLEKVHPIDPGTVANFAYGMHGRLPDTTPPSIYDNEYIQLMDAGMSNNLPLYPLMRPGRGVEVLIAFDASADTKTDNWLAVADGYARQRKIKGWPVGIGWPKAGEAPEELTKELENAEASDLKDADRRLNEAQIAQKKTLGKNTTDDLGYCTVWVGTSQERSTSPPPPSRALDDSTHWHISEPDAGIAVVYLPLLGNPEAVPGVSPGESDFLSTWNFVYTPEQIDQVVALARANYAQGQRQIRETVRAVYLRKKKLRETKEKERKSERYRGLVRRGMGTRLGEGDQFS
ncbi:cytosolic phospholipase A2 zeta [Verticillium alfalfae VaMs.102]|uniref:Lysophospholipase n=1 Tax=Verticillium alfalfae (strain VaMs.102 / ATCC MYA-4576 / FGSC 10136) TaxID=526221 RepID=C9S5A5_VERA1|nr:cytosolic phospholipase A2 zeta [Verticillium alfalfae VaMs.102]EEY15013.1 cytosolic phospholipase A2 zeta [Verticillium alfalfae VaMs.102]